jgi:hypothetical protein
MAFAEKRSELSASMSAAAPALNGAPRKLRAFVLERDGGAPAEGVTVLAKRKIEGDSEEIVGVLASDAAGYVSFDLGENGADGVEELWLEAADEPDARVAIADPTRRTPSGDVAVLAVSPRSRDRRPAAARVSVQRPDLRDWELSPKSFVAPRELAVGEGGCQRPVPAGEPLCRLRFVQVVRRPALREGGLDIRGAGVRESGLEVGRSVLAERGLERTPGAVMVERTPAGLVSEGVMLDPAASDRDGQKLAPLLCDILELEQVWHDVGHSLGNVLYSLPLAPCESVDLAIIDASRSDYAIRTDDIVSTEDLDHELHRDRNIQESVALALKESQGGWSLMGGLAGAYQEGAGSATGTLGGAVSHSWGKRNLGGKSVQDLHDGTVQATDVVRTLNSTVIVQASQTEQHRLETRTVRNHNHCHALTIQYYEVLRRLKLETRLAGARPGILIPYRYLTFAVPTQPHPSIQPDPEDLRLVSRVRPVLERLLLRPELRPNFEAARRLLYFPTATPPPAPQPTPKIVPDPGAREVTGILFRLKRGQWGTAGGLKPQMPLSVRLTIRTRDGGIVPLTYTLPNYDQTLESGEAQVFDLGLEGDKSEDYLEWLSDHRVGFSRPIRRSELDEIQVHWLPHALLANPMWSFRGIDVRAMTADGPKPLLLVEATDPDDLAPQFRDFEAEGQRPFAIPPPAAETDKGDDEKDKDEDKEGGQPPQPTPEQDRALAWELIGHLHDHGEHYSARLLAAKSPGWFAHQLDELLGPQNELRESIDPQPVAVSGPYLVFPYNGSTDSPDYEAPPQESITSLPTRGLLAEAQLGSCNACEKRDVTRFWKWEESPCTEEPPAIEGVTPGFRGLAPNLEPTALPSSVVQITQPPAAPDPVGLAAALNLLGQPDLFRDMSGLPELGQLLSGLASGAVDLATAERLARQAKDKLGQGGGTDGRGPGIADHRSSQERYDDLQVAREVARVGPELGWDGQTTAAVTSGIVGGVGAALPPATDADGKPPLPLRLLNELVMGATSGTLASEPTLSDARTRGEKLPTRILSTMSKPEFFGMTPTDRADWYRRQLEPFTRQFRESSAAHSVPPQLVAGVIFAELIDITKEDVAQGLLLVTEGSVGIAQIQIKTAIDEKLFTDISKAEERDAWEEFLSSPLVPTSAHMLLWDTVLKKPGDELRMAVSRRLRTPQHAIDAASRYIRLHLERASGNRTKAWPVRHGFSWTGSPVSNPQDFYNFVSGTTLREREGGLAAMVAGIFNTPSVLRAGTLGPDDVPNAEFQADSARRIAGELFDLQLFRPSP